MFFLPLQELYLFADKYLVSYIYYLTNDVEIPHY